MTPVDQQHGRLVDGALGDCWRACIATLLDLPCEDLPHFAELYGVQRMTGETDAWLALRGKRLRFLDPSTSALVACTFTATSWTPLATQPVLPEYVLVTGWANERHSVVGHLETLRTWIAGGYRPPIPFVHDPNPSRMGIRFPLKNIFAIVDDD